jgi:hypothetical protein
MSYLLPLAVTLIWTIYGLPSVIKKKSRSIKRFKPLIIALLIVFETVIIVISIRTNRSTSYIYPVSLGITLLIIGRGLSHLGWMPHKNRLFIIWDRWVHNVFNFQQQRIYLDVLGDWIQLIGISFVWNSVIGVLFATILFSIFALYVFIHQTLEQDAQIRNNKLWPGFRIVFSIGFVAVLPTLLLAIILRDVYIFWGTSTEASDLLVTLLQIEAALGAIIAAILFLLVELSASSYTPRITQLISTRKIIQLVLFLAVFSATAKVLFISNFVTTQA